MVPAQLLGYMYLGPSFTMTQGLAGVRERAGAVLLLIINLIGLGLGPALAGWISDAYRSSFESGGMGTSLAVAEGLPYSLVTMTLVNFWSATHYLLAARYLRGDLEDVRREQTERNAEAVAYGDSAAPV